MADRRIRDEPIRSVHKPAMSLSTGRRLGARLRPRIKDAQLMFDEHRFGNDRTEPARSCQPDQSDDQMNEKR